MVKALVQFIETSCETAKFKRAIVAMSGGLDSSTSAALAVRALGAKNVYPLLLPYRDLRSTDDAKLVITNVGIPKSNITQIDIAPFVDPMIALDPTMDRVRRGNIMARVRMILLYDE